METREAYLTKLFLTITEQKLIYRLRQLRQEQCRGALLLFESEGFILLKLSRQEKIAD